MNRVIWARRSFKVQLPEDTFSRPPRPKRVEWVRGITWGHFGIYKGHRSGPRPDGIYFTVVLLSCMAPFLTVPLQRNARQAAMELGALDLDWSAPEQKNVTGPGLEKAKDVWGRWNRYERDQQEEYERKYYRPRTWGRRAT